MNMPNGEVHPPLLPLCLWELFQPPSDALGTRSAKCSCGRSLAAESAATVPGRGVGPGVGAACAADHASRPPVLFLRRAPLPGNSEPDQAIPDSRQRRRGADGRRQLRGRRGEAQLLRRSQEEKKCHHALVINSNYYIS